MKMKSFEKIPETTDQSDEISGNLKSIGLTVSYYFGRISYTYAIACKLTGLYSASNRDTMMNAYGCSLH